MGQTTWMNRDGECHSISSPSKVWPTSTPSCVWLLAEDVVRSNQFVFFQS